MFARTARLTLRPPWPEDATALAAAMNPLVVTPGSARVPCTPTDVATWTAAPRGAHEPRFVIETHAGDGPALIGAIAITDDGDGAHLVCWLTPAARGRGYATEAGRAVIEMARHALPIDALYARRTADDPAFARVLEKLGFRSPGEVGMTFSHARGERHADLIVGLKLARSDVGQGCDGPMPLAA